MSRGLFQLDRRSFGVIAIMALTFISCSSAFSQSISPIPCGLTNATFVNTSPNQLINNSPTPCFINSSGTLINNSSTINDTGANLINLGHIANGSVANDVNAQFFNNGSFTNGPNSGEFDNNGAFFNNGTVTNDNGGTVLFNNFNTFINNSGGALNNLGTFGGGGFLTNAGAVTNNGTMSVNTFTQTAGQTLVNGTLNTVSGVQIQGGILSGTGTINGDVNNSGGIVQPSSSVFPASAGTLTINGNYTQGPSGNLTIDLGGTAPGAFSALNVSGLATLGGTLDLTSLNGFTPSVGDDFTFLQFGTVSGDFSNIVFPDCPVGATCTEDFGPNSITLDIDAASTTPTPEPSTLLLLGSGILALSGCFRWKRISQVRAYQMPRPARKLRISRNTSASLDIKMA